MQEKSQTLRESFANSTSARSSMSSSKADNDGSSPSSRRSRNIRASSIRRDFGTAPSKIAKRNSSSLSNRELPRSIAFLRLFSPLVASLTDCAANKASIPPTTDAPTEADVSDTLSAAPKNDEKPTPDAACDDVFFVPETDLAEPEDPTLPMLTVKPP